MAGGNVASAHVELVPTFGGNGALTNSITKQLGGVSLAGAGKSLGNSFNSGFKGSVGGLASWFKSGAVMGAVSSIATSAMNTISSSMDSAIARADTLANFPKVMTSLGYSFEEAARSSDIMAKAVDGLPTRLQDMTGNVQMLAATMGNLADGEVNATTVGKAFNDMMLAGGQGTEAASAAFTQYAQMLAVGKVDQMAWNSVVRAAPGQVDQLAKSLLGAEANQKTLYQAMLDGTVSFDDFNAAIVRLDTEGGEGFASFEQQARDAVKGVGTSLENLGNSVTSNIAKVVGKLNENGEVAGALDFLKGRVNEAGDWVSGFVGSLKSSIDLDGFARAFGSLGDAVAGVFGQGPDAASFGELVGNAVNGLIPIVESLRGPVELAAGAIKGIAEFAADAAPSVVAFAVGLKLTQAAVKGALLVKQLPSILAGIAGKAAPAAAGMFGTAAAEEAVGGASAASARQILSAGVAFIALGAGVALAAAGLWVLTQAAVQIAETGPGAALALGGLVLSIAALAAGAALVGPALTAGAVGMVAFGAAVLLVGAGVLLASTGVAALSGALPALAACGMQAAAASLALGGGLLALGAGAFVAGAGAVVLGAGLALAGAGLVLVAAGATLAAAGVVLLGAGVVVLGAGVMMAAAGLAQMAESLPTIANDGPGAALALTELAGASVASSVGLLAAAPGLVALGDAANGAIGGIDGLNGAAVSMNATLTASVAAANGASASLAQLSAAFASGGVSAKSFTTSVTASVAAAKAAVSSGMRQMAATVAGTRLKMQRIEVGPLPHFSFSGSFNAETKEVPTLNVSWYAKGGIFSSPQIVGVGDASSPEVVAPISKLPELMDGSGYGSEDVVREIRDLHRDLGRIIEQYGFSLDRRTFGRAVRREAVTA